MATESEPKGLSGPIARWIFILAALAAIVTVLISIYGLIHEKSKSVSLTLSEPVPLLRSENIHDDLFISIEGKQIRQAWLQTITYRNSGQIPIRSSDIEDATRISFENDTKIISTNTREKKPNNLKAWITRSGNEITINHGLLNNNDHILIDVFIENATDKLPRCNVRIVGIEICNVSRMPSKTSQFKSVFIELVKPIDNGQVFFWFVISLFMLVLSVSMISIEIFYFFAF